MSIFMEYIPGGALRGMLDECGFIPECVVRLFLKQILAGLLYLHRMGIIHGDIKCANILVSQKNMETVLKLTDFGCSLKKGPQVNPTAQGRVENRG